MCLQEFSIVLIMFGVHNICKSVGTMKKKKCSAVGAHRVMITSLNTSKLLAL